GGVRTRRRTAGRGIRSRSARTANRTGISGGGAEAGQRRPGESGRTARDEFPIVPVLREKIQFALIDSSIDNDRQPPLTNNVNLPDRGSYQSCIAEEQPI